MKLKISENLSFPEELVTQKIGILGRSGSGKSFLSSKMVELLLDHGFQVVIVDPVGIHYGLRLGSDGKSPGYPIPVFGGQKGDIPLDPNSGTLVADIIVDKSLSLVLDVSEFSGGENRKFITDFAKQLLKKKKQNRSPIMLVWEESQEFISQRVFKQDAPMVGAMEKLIKIGRNFGVGTTLISQRPQAVNKDVLNQTEVLIVFQITGPQERKAIEGWIVEHGLDRKEFSEELPSLPQGTAWLWSPQWLGKLIKIRALPKKTFDVSATPKFQKNVVPTLSLSPIDLEKIKESMAHTIERNKLDDPKELRKIIHGLEMKLKHPMVKLEERIVEVPVLKQELILSLEDKFQAISDEVKKLFKEMKNFKHLPGPITNIHVENSPKKLRKLEQRPVLPIYTTDSVNEEISDWERKLLTGLAMYTNEGGRTKHQLAVLCIYAQSGTFSTYLSKLRTSGYIEGSSHISITLSGLKYLGKYDPLPTGRDLLEAWLDKLAKGQKVILETLYLHYPDGYTKDELAEKVDSAMSGTFSTYLSKLNKLSLISKKDGKIMASEELFQ